CRVIREPRGQRLFDGSPGLIAVFRALHRLLAPRHPPHALSSLAALTPRLAASPRSRHRAVAPRHRGPPPWPKRACVTNDPLSFSQAHAEKHTQLLPLPWSRPLGCGGVVMQLLPLPNCQRTQATSESRRGHLTHEPPVATTREGSRGQGVSANPDSPRMGRG